MACVADHYDRPAFMICVVCQSVNFLHGAGSVDQLSAESPEPLPQTQVRRGTDDDRGILLGTSWRAADLHPAHVQIVHHIIIVYNRTEG